MHNDNNFGVDHYIIIDNLQGIELCTKYQSEETV